MNESEEYKFISGSQDYCQKVLNQWKHKYLIQIIDMHIDVSSDGCLLCTLLVIRTKILQV